MRENKTKCATIKTLDIMIQNVAKGASGFWVDDHEGCGNPKIFPEFEEGLKRGTLVQKEHFLCPWNTAVLYGKGHGNIRTGCYHSCSIDKACFLSEKMMKNVLIRFKERLKEGDYDSKDDISPLLTVDECKYIENEMKRTQQLAEQKRINECNVRIHKARKLIEKYPNEKSLLASCYGENEYIGDGRGIIFFAPNSREKVVGAEKMSYDEYLDVQLASLNHKYRSGFANGLFNCLLEFKGQIEKITQKYICFKRISIAGMHPDGSSFDDKEDHVWMDKTHFENFNVGDSVSFCAEVYRYIKTSNGKMIDYGLRNPEGIEKIESYRLPSDDDLKKQAISEMICETCYMNEYCNRMYCIFSSSVKEQEKQMMLLLKETKE